MASLSFLETIRREALAPEAVLKDAGAKRAYHQLIDAGVDVNLLCKMLSTLEALFRSAPAPHRKKTPHWALLAGMSLSTLTRFPSKLDAIATQIDMLNKHPFFFPDYWVNFRFDRAEEAQRKIIAQHFRLLPGILRWYAFFVKRQPASVGKWRRSLGRSDKLVDGMILCLIFFIKRAAKKPCYHKVADLLNSLDPRKNAAWTESRLEKNYNRFATAFRKARQPK